MNSNVVQGQVEEIPTTEGIEGLVKPTHGFWQRFWISVQNVAVLFKYDVSWLKPNLGLGLVWNCTIQK